MLLCFVQVSPCYWATYMYHHATLLNTCITMLVCYVHVSPCYSATYLYHHATLLRTCITMLLCNVDISPCYFATSSASRYRPLTPRSRPFCPLARPDLIMIHLRQIAKQSSNHPDSPLVGESVRATHSWVASLPYTQDSPSRNEKTTTIRLFAANKNRIVTAFRHFRHKYCLLMR